MRTDNYNGTLSMLAADATSPAALAALTVINATLTQASANANNSGLSLVALGTQPVWLPSVDDVNQALYCGYRAARCNGTSAINAVTNAWDFGGTTAAGGVYSLRLWYNATGRYAGDGNAPTALVRVQGAFNAATNAFLRWSLGPEYGARLVGLMEMPKVRQFAVSFYEFLPSFFRSLN